MTDTSIPEDAETSSSAATDASPGAGAAEASVEAAGASDPVTVHPAHDMVAELLDTLHLAGVEHVFRSVFEWLGRHASEISTIAPDIAPRVEEATDRAADL